MEKSIYDRYISIIDISAEISNVSGGDLKKIFDFESFKKDFSFSLLVPYGIGFIMAPYLIIAKYKIINSMEFDKFIVITSFFLCFFLKNNYNTY